MPRASLIATSLLVGLLAAALPSFAAPPARHDVAPAAAKATADKQVTGSDTLKLVGPAGQMLTLKAADFAALPHITLKASIHDKTYTFEGVELTGLLAKVGAPTGQALRGPEMSKIVMVTATDGYRLALSLVETDPRFRANRIIVADKMDGQPLNPHDGPFRLVVEGDLDAGRLVRNLATIEVRKLD